MNLDMTNKEKIKNRLLLLAQWFFETKQDPLFVDDEEGNKYSISLKSWNEMCDEYKQKYGEEL